MAPPPNVQGRLKPMMDRLREAHPIARYHRAALIQQQLAEVASDVAMIKRSAIRELRAQGMGLTDLARAFGVSATRIQQVEQGMKPRPKTWTERRAEQLLIPPPDEDVAATS